MEHWVVSPVASLLPVGRPLCAGLSVPRTYDHVEHEHQASLPPPPHPIWTQYLPQPTPRPVMPPLPPSLGTPYVCTNGRLGNNSSTVSPIMPLFWWHTLSPHDCTFRSCRHTQSTHSHLAACTPYHPPVCPWLAAGPHPLPTIRTELGDETLHTMGNTNSPEQLASKSRRTASSQRPLFLTLRTLRKPKAPKQRTGAWGGGGGAGYVAH